VMASFRYLAPLALGQALEILAAQTRQVKILAGGTDVLVQMRAGTVRPRLVLDIAGLAELKGVRQEDGWIWIGPLCTHQELAGSDLIQRHGLALAQGAALVGSPQIRLRGTIGGNLANASPAADTVPPLVALGAEVQISSLAGSRWVAVESLLQGPAQTTLHPDELITGLRIPARPGKFLSRYEKFGTRNALSIAVASVSAAAMMAEPGHLTGVRIALGSVSPTVMRARGAEELLSASRLDLDLIAQAAASAARECCPIDDVRGSAWYRQHLVEVLLTRILMSWKDGG